MQLLSLHHYDKQETVKAQESYLDCLSSLIRHDHERQGLVLGESECNQLMLLVEFDNLLEIDVHYD